MSIESAYNQEFYEWIREGSRRSAREIIPLVLELIQPQSVVDVGCGDGTWLSVFKEFNIQECLGIDGEYVHRDSLQISPLEFLASDLKLPLIIDKKFDLVMSLEVAEHLPSDCAEIFVDSLTKLGSVVLFSAAIPYQEGTGHINEQWPSYWVSLFENRGYLVVDCLRKKIWDNDKVEAWYAQNILLFVQQDCLKSYPLLAKLQQTNLSGLAVVHPKLYLSKVHKRNAIAPLRSPKFTKSAVELRVNENRFGCLDIEITDVQLLPGSEINSGDSLEVIIEYYARQPIYAPIFGVSFIKYNNQICFGTNTKKLNCSLSLIQDKGQIKLSLESLALEQGQYFVDVGIYERNWAYTYDYHWHVYLLRVNSQQVTLEQLNLENSEVK